MSLLEHRLVVVCDRDPTRRVLTATWLREAGAAVVEAATGNECLRAVRRRVVPDLLVLDSALPDADGVDLCARIKGDRRTAHIRVLQHFTELTRPEDRVRSVLAGADWYVVAPITEEELVRCAAALTHGVPGDATRRLIDLAEGSPVPMALMGPEGFTAWNHAWARVADVGGDGPLEALGLTGPPRDGDTVDVSGTSLRVAIADTPIGQVVSLLDVSREVSQINALREQTHMDELTGLANHQMLTERLDQATAQADRHEHLMAVLFLDLDRFKPVNDTHGHAVGDRLLIQVARRLSDLVRTEDTVARMGGDEFAIVVPHLNERGQAMALAHRIARVLGQPYTIAGNSIEVGASVGVAVRDARESSDMLLEHADAAMYQAKAEHHGGVALYSEPVSARMRLRSALQSAVAHAVREGSVSFQSCEVAGPDAKLSDRRIEPVVSVGNSTVHGSELSEIARAAGVSGDLGAGVLQVACTLAALRPIGGRTWARLDASVWERPELASTVAEALEDAAAEPEAVGLLLPPMHLRALERVEDQVQVLQSIGVQVGLDEFGAGVSLELLRGLHFDRLVLTQIVVKAATGAKADRAILHAISNLAAELGVAVEATGIDGAEAAAIASAEGATWMSGDHVGPWTPIETRGWSATPA